MESSLLQCTYVYIELKGKCINANLFHFGLLWFVLISSYLHSIFSSGYSSMISFWVTKGHLIKTTVIRIYCCMRMSPIAEKVHDEQI